VRPVGSQQLIVRPPLKIGSATYAQRTTKGMINGLSDRLMFYTKPKLLILFHDFEDPRAAPEPSTVVLMIFAIATMAIRRKRHPSAVSLAPTICPLSLTATA
jgi:hypothetical protein